ncbi:hypothetical protein Ae168Ps1_2794c [Pseudonocardia sp. Ae168_Ps1]|uniref:hypothetical protein n=1 Tax=unclassified Pseudonocardia TaxID=2619320 RepID=UPI00094B188C|nr:MULTISPECIES: hypothetical protein [unclassified Pseudonocardia]OLL74409.1 hypothetical protein Ae150APs1_2787c [Pseudonocardia sp. Ae150A_Ps1]OLL80388.1 hypothetical protein Ae168Ps1_2794c [Pseudonocardia sp. Ae168_Ps1]OLL85484.1 hypothetical protein Ae263Ps1_2539 [Pseudonocardia sp. Ae263_Ps1]OLL94489.1 hypothetical protein Ae356Ps1_4386c [Pseudonocardia sp. Ae356_Ps1]
MDRSTKRTARPGLQVGLWIAAAVGALVLGMTAVGTIGSGLGGDSGTQPLAAEEIEARLARQVAAEPGAGAAPPAPQQPAAPQPAAQQPAGKPPPAVVPAGPGGTILARCAGTTPEVVSVNPAQGFERDDEDDAGPGRVGLDGDDVDVVVALSCADGVPSGQVTVLAED